MHTIIKLGGSNLKSPGQLISLLDFLKAHKKSLIVVSALYGITEKLINELNKAELRTIDIQNFCKGLYVYHLKFLNESNQESHLVQQYNEGLKQEIIFLQSAFISYQSASASRRASLKAGILSSGERLSTFIVAAYLAEERKKTMILFPEDIQLIADEQLVIREIKNPKPLEQFPQSVFPGFYAMSANGNRILLGRGGSDYSATSLASLLDANEVILLKDANGVRTADPRLVSNHIPVHSLSYNEASELAYFGAGILHPSCVQVLIDKQIPLKIFYNENTSAPATIISQDYLKKASVVKSIASGKSYSLIRLKGAGVGYQAGLLGKASQYIYNSGYNIQSVLTSQTCINFLMNEEIDQEKIRSVLNFENCSVEIITGLGLLALVGEGMSSAPGIVAGAAKALSDNGINVIMSVSGASDVAMYLVVEQEVTNKALSCLHHEFFESKINHKFELKSIKYENRI